MVSSAIIHVIGTTMLIAILFLVIIYTSTSTYTLIVSNEKENLQKIANSIALQLTYLLYIKANSSLSLNYPVMSIYDSEYNIIIGSGSAIKSRYPFISGLDNESIYVVTTDPSNNIYTYSFVVKNSSNQLIIINPNPQIFGSTTITVVEKIIEGNKIIITCRIEGWKTS